MFCYALPYIALSLSTEIKAAYSPYGHVVTMIKGRACKRPMHSVTDISQLSYAAPYKHRKSVIVGKGVVIIDFPALS